MRSLELGLWALMAVVVVGGCAKKRPLPPRGEMVGTVELSPGLGRYLDTRYNLRGDKHCLMVVELSEDRGTALEISHGDCPAGNALAEKPVATLMIWGGWSPADSVPGKPMLLLAGDKPASVDNHPVGFLTTDHVPGINEPPHFKVTDLCTPAVNTAPVGHPDPSRYWHCTLAVDAGQGLLTGIRTNRYLTLAHAMVVRAEGLTAKVGTMETTIGTMQMEIADLRTKYEAMNKILTKWKDELKIEEVIPKLQKAVDEVLPKAITDAVKALDTKLQNEYLKNLETKLRDAFKAADEKVIADLRSEILAAVKDEKGDSSDLAKAIKARFDAAIQKALADGKTALAQELAKFKKDQLDTSYLKLADVEKEVKKLLKTAEDNAAAAKDAADKLTKGEVVPKNVKLALSESLLAAKRALLAALQVELYIKQGQLEKVKGTADEARVKEEIEGSDGKGGLKKRIADVEAEIKKLEGEIAGLKK